MGPDYSPPVVEIPAEFKEGPGWKIAEPRDHLSRGRWWEVFGDPTLNRLEEQLALDNQNLKAAYARYRQALAQAEMVGAAFFPDLTGQLGVVRGKSGNTRGETTTRNVSLSSSWELDLWGRIRRGVAAGEANAEAEQADLEGARLGLHAQMAQNYFLLRVVEQQQQFYRETLAAYEKSLIRTKNRNISGVVTLNDVAQAENQLESARAQALEIDLQQAQLEHLLAQLTGHSPVDFSLESAPFSENLPEVPPVFPSELLERRPDVAASERRVAAANARIGVAAAAFFPTLTLGISGGFQGAGSTSWFAAPARFWSLGPSLAASLFDGGLRQAQHRHAVAVYDQAVADYRQTVLDALQEVEDTLVALRLLKEEAKAMDLAVRAARRVRILAENQYRAGVVSYLEVISAQTAALVSERSASSLMGRRYTATITLIKALGGDWQR